MADQQFPSELRRAEYLLSKLNTALYVATKFKSQAVKLEFDNAQELADLLSDSIRSLKNIKEPLHEFDGTAGNCNYSSAKQDANLYRLINNLKSIPVIDAGGSDQLLDD